MKNIILYIFAVVLLFSSCSEDWLNLESKSNAVEDTFYKTDNDFYQALIAAYDPLQHNGSKFGSIHEYYNFALLSNILSDDMWSGGGNESDRTGYIAAEKGQADPSAADFNALYITIYKGIYRANLVINKAQGDNELTEFQRSQYIGEAKFLRGLYYFRLVRMWANVPLITTLETLESLSQYPQANPGDIYNQVASDFYDAYNTLPASYSGSEIGRATKWAAAGFLVREYLYHEGYGKSVLGLTDLTAGETIINGTKALEIVNDIVLNSGAGLVQDLAMIIHPSNENNIESLFEVQHSSESNWGDYFTLPRTEGNLLVNFYGIRSTVSNIYGDGWSYGTISLDLYQAFPEDDPRRFITIIDPEDPVEGIEKYSKALHNTGYFYKKYTPLKAYEPTSGDSRLNWENNEVLLRFADIKLMAAELEFTNGDVGKALIHLQDVQERAGVDKASSIDLDAIYRERRLELAGEGGRYWDLLRRGLDVAKSEIDIKLNNEFTSTFTLATKGLMPIPQQEMNQAAGRWTQNAGY